MRNNTKDINLNIMPIGATLKIGRKVLKVVRTTTGCKGCAYRSDRGARGCLYSHCCFGNNRLDKQSVKFVKAEE